MTELSTFWETTSGTGDSNTSGYSQTLMFALLNAMTARTANLGGVCPDYLNELAVTGTSSPVSVDTGAAFVQGIPYSNSASKTVAISTPASQTRVDYIVLRADYTAETVRITRIAGTEGAGAPSLTQSAGTTWDIPLATASITTGGVITVTDAREWIGKVGDLTVDSTKLASNAVTTAKITDSNVTAAKLATDSVSTAKITDSNVTTAKIADSNITTAKIADNAVTNAKTATMSANTVKANNTGSSAIPSDVDIATLLAAYVHAATSKGSPIGADELLLIDTEASNALKKATITNAVSADVVTVSTFTPALSADGGGTPSYTARTGTYAKIGKLVYLTFYIVLSSKGTLSGNLRISGLPYTVAASGYHICDVEFASAASNFIRLWMQLANSDTYGDLYFVSAAGAATNNLFGTTHINNNVQLWGSITYITT